MKKKFDNLGRICIPKHIREDLALDENSYLSIEYDKNQKQITLKKNGADLRRLQQCRRPFANRKPLPL